MNRTRLKLTADALKRSRFIVAERNDFDYSSCNLEKFIRALMSDSPSCELAKLAHEEYGELEGSKID